MSDKINTVILAAGKGTRLKVDTPKPLIMLENKALVDYVIDAFVDFGEVIIVTGHKSEEVEAHLAQGAHGDSLSYVLQKEQKGTGHAIQVYFDGFQQASSSDFTIVACADTPLITKEVVEKLVDEMKGSELDAVVASFEEKNPTGYGRIIRGEQGLHIVEEKDANDEEKAVQEVNSAFYVFRTDFLLNEIKKLDNDNNSGEFYLPDVFTFGSKTKAVLFEDKTYFLGVNDMYQLSVVERRLISRNIKELLISGVRVIDPSHCYIYSRDIGKASTIYPNVFIDSDSKIGENVTIEQGCVIKNSQIGDGSYIKAHTYITDSSTNENVTVGPMAQLRPGTHVESGSKIGNFVEVKNSSIGKNTNISHLSYVGDAELGSEVNIGCGFITCNYDGAKKHKTIIGDGSFIGSDCQVIAPIEIGEEAYVGSGSTINRNVPSGAFAIARSRQDTREGMARRFIKKKDPK